MGFDCRKICQGFVIALVPFLVLRNSKFSLTTFLITFCNCIRLVAAVFTIEGGLPVNTGTASSCVVASALEEFVSMVAALREAKKLRVTTTFGGCLRRQTLRSALLS
jgi:hypothetical protein